MPALTVLHVLEAVGHGTGRHVVDLIRHCGEVRHHLVVPTLPTSRGETGSATADLAAAAGAHVHTVPMRRAPVHPDLLRAIVGVRALVRRLAPEVVHGHATVGGTVARLAAAGTGVPTVYTPNGLHPSRPVRLAERALAPLTARLIAVSESEAALAAEIGCAPRGGTTVIPNGIDPDRVVPPPLDLRRALRVGEGARLVGFVGRLARQKAPEVLVEAAARLGGDRADPPVHLVLVGGGPDRDAVAAQVARLDARRWVHLLGHVRHAAGLLPQLDVLALPSRWEGGPYVPLEAFRAGTPVVVADVVGARDLVEDGRTGLVVPAGDPAALAAALQRLLADRRLAAECAEAAAAVLRARYDVRAMAARTALLYREIVGV